MSRVSRGGARATHATKLGAMRDMDATELRHHMGREAKGPIG